MKTFGVTIIIMALLITILGGFYLRQANPVKADDLKLGPYTLFAAPHGGRGEEEIMLLDTSTGEVLRYSSPDKGFNRVPENK